MIIYKYIKIHNKVLKLDNACLHLRCGVKQCYGATAPRLDW